VKCAITYQHDNVYKLNGYVTEIPQAKSYRSRTEGQLVVFVILPSGIYSSRIEGRRKFTCFCGTNNLWRHFEMKEFADYSILHKAHPSAPECAIY